jgi:hypothetical protein
MLRMMMRISRSLRSSRRDGAFSPTWRSGISPPGGRFGCDYRKGRRRLLSARSFCTISAQFFAEQCVQEGRHVQWETVPLEEKVRNLCSLGRIRGGNEADEADRRSHLRDGERVTGPQRNASEPSGGLEKKITPEAEPAVRGRRQHGRPWADRSGLSLRRGGEGQHGDKDMSSNWRNRPRPTEKSGGAGRSYNRQPREID